MRNALIIAVAAVLGFAIVFFTREPEQPELETPATDSPAPAPDAQAEPMAAPAATRATSTSASTPTPMSAPISPDSAPPAADTNYRRLLADSTDLLPLVETLHARAKAGDGAAQYWLAQALTLCDPASRQGVDPEQARALNQKCQGLKAAGKEKYGVAAEWVAQSSQAGYPLGQVAHAGNQIAAASRGEASRESTIGESKRLVVAALRSGDPEVVMQTSQVAFLLKNPTVDTYKEAKASAEPWKVAACMRGADCSPQADWVRSGCRQDKACQPYETGLDLLRRSLGARYDDVERQARDINAQIDAGNWKALGLE
jgi:hypothetical protein